MNYIDPLALTVWTVVIGVSFIFMLAKVCRSIKFFRIYRQDLKARIEVLRIHKMLNRIGVGLPRYLRKARSTDIELHLIKCQGCKTTQICDTYLDEGGEVDEKRFCPNYGNLKKYG